VTPNQLPPLARQALDRDYLLRANRELFSILENQATSMALVMHRGKVLLESTTKAALKLMPLALAPKGKLRVYLGKATSSSAQVAEGAGICLVVLEEVEANTLEPEESSWHTLRATGAGLSDLDAGIFTQSLALHNWHETHSFCPRCGQKTVIEQGGWVRRCESENLELFPRTDPAIIVSILDQQDRILLGSQGVWEENRWSILAGFVEPGESLEAAVVREMKEESGLDVLDPKYVYSQGWPYPYSLMLGYTARADSSQQLKPDGEEIVRLRWFTREELASEAKQLLLPGRATISRALIELWFGGQLDSASEVSSNGQQ
jgi:NAD+ diphosphatase